MKRNNILVLLMIMYPATLAALTFPMPKNGNILGATQTTTSQIGESLGEIGRRFDIGIYEMIEANPNVNPWTPRSGTKITIPSKFILPPGPKEGIVINLAEMRMYYYHPDGNYVSTYPIGIGRKGWLTPLGEAKITKKEKDPAWYPPESIKQSYAKKGKILPNVVPAGPDNPLGQYAMKLSLPGGYLIHGTNQPGGIGVRSSSGCIRMFPEDIESLYYKTNVGTKVTIIHVPYKIGKRNDEVYIEAHEPLSESYYQQQSQTIMNQQAIDDAAARKNYIGSKNEIKQLVGEMADKKVKGRSINTN